MNNIRVLSGVSQKQAGQNTAGSQASWKRVGDSHILS